MFEVARGTGQPGTKCRNDITVVEEPGHVWPNVGISAILKSYLVLASGEGCCCTRHVPPINMEPGS